MVGFGARKPYGAAIAVTPILRLKWANISETNIGAIQDVQPRDNGPLGNHTKFQLDWSKNGRVMAEKRMPIYGHKHVAEANFGLQLGQTFIFFNETNFIR